MYVCVVGGGVVVVGPHPNGAQDLPLAPDSGSTRDCTKRRLTACQVRSLPAENFSCLRMFL